MLNIKDIEAAYLLKILLNQLKIGVGIKIIKQFLSIKHSINIETIENIFSKINNIDIIISTIENYHKESHYIQQKNLLFQPIKYMLASIPPLNIEDILMKKNTWRVE